MIAKSKFGYYAEHFVSNYNAIVIDPLVDTEPLIDWETIKGISLAPDVAHKQQHLLPMLYDLEAIPEEQFKNLCDQIDLRLDTKSAVGFSGLLKSKTSATSLASHLKSRASIADEQTGRWVYLRLHDPRVFHHLVNILRPQQVQTWFPPLTALTLQLKR